MMEEDLSQSDDVHVWPSLNIILKEAPRRSYFRTKYNLSENAVLNKGGFSICLKCTDRKSKKEYAVKVLKQQPRNYDELKMLKRCQGHTNILRLHHHIRDSKFFYIFTELCEGGDLCDRIETQRINEKEACGYMQQIISGLEHIHRKKIIHGDIKAENILFVDKDRKKLRISDFGGAISMRQLSRYHRHFTNEYAAPELIKYNAISTASDMWAVGVLLYCVLCEEMPFETVNSLSEGPNKSETWETLSASVQNLILGLLQQSKNNRLTIDGVKAHPWFMENGVEFPNIHTNPRNGLIAEKTCIVGSKKPQTKPKMQRMALAEFNK